MAQRVVRAPDFSDGLLARIFPIVSPTGSRLYRGLAARLRWILNKPRISRRLIDSVTFGPFEKPTSD